MVHVSSAGATKKITGPPGTAPAAPANSSHRLYGSIASGARETQQAS